MRQLVRRSYPNCYCDDSTIASRSTVASGFSINCLSANCYGLSNLGAIINFCIDYNVMKDITFTEGSLIVNIPSNVTIEAAFQGFYLPIEM